MGAGSALLGVTLCTWQGTGQPGARVLGAEQGAGGRSCWLPTAAPRVLPWVAQHWHCPPLPMGSCLVPTLLAPCNGSGTVPITAAASPPLAIAFSPCRQTGTVPLQPSPSRGDCPTPKHAVPTSQPFAQFCPCGQLHVCAGSSSPRCVLTAPPRNTSCPAGRHLLRELLRLPPAVQRDTGGLPGTRWLLSPALACVHVCVPEVPRSRCGQCCPAGVWVALGTHTATPTPVTQAQEDGAGARPGTVVLGHGALQRCPTGGFAMATTQQLARMGCGMHTHTHPQPTPGYTPGGRWGSAPRPLALAVPTLPAHPQCLGRMRCLGAPPESVWQCCPGELSVPPGAIPPCLGNACGEQGALQGGGTQAGCPAAPGCPQGRAGAARPSSAGAGWGGPGRASLC